MPNTDHYNSLPPGPQRLEYVRNQFLVGRGFDGSGNFDPRNANTFDSALVPNVAADVVITTMANRLGVLKAFPKTVDLAGMKPKVPVIVPIYTTGSAAVTNATNFEDAADSTLDDRPVTPAQITKKFHITNDQINQGHAMLEVLEGSANLFADAISDAVTAVMTTVNFGTALTIGVGSDFAANDLPPILAAAKNYSRKILLIDGGHLAYLLPVDRTSFRLGEGGAYGFDAIYEQNRWTGATTNTAGFVTGPSSIAIASGPPVEHPALLGAGLNAQTITVPQLGLAARIYLWGNSATRTVFGSYDIVFGAAVGDATQAEVLITA